MKSLSFGCKLAKLDLKNAYRIIPVHLDDRHLLGLSHRHETFIDAALPFGLRSAPKIFSAMADALLWVIAKKGVQNAIHYLDDFLLVGPADSNDCDTALCRHVPTSLFANLCVCPSL